MRAADPAWRRLLDHLAMAGPSDLDDLRLELDLKRQELKALRYPLERCGAIVARSVAMTSAGGAAEGESHAHSTELSRWDQAYRRPRPAAPPSAPRAPGRPAARCRDPATALGDLLVAAVRAAVVAPEAELRRWFSWQWYWTDTLVDDLVRSGRLRRVDGYLAAALPAASPPYLRRGDQTLPELT